MTQEKKTEEKISRRSYLKYVGGAVVVAGAAAAGYYYYTSMPPPGATTTVAPLPTTTAGPITVVLGDVDELGKLDPHIGSFSQEARLYPNMYDALTEYDDSVPPQVMPLLAESWDVSPDGKEYTFHLVKGAKFHDGNEVTADDVVFSMNRSVVLKQGFSFMWDPVISSTAAVDKYTARMILNVPFAPFPATMAYFFVVNKKVILEHLKKPGPYGDMGDYGTEWLVQGGDKGTLAGSGPYAWLERVPGTQDKFERFKDYWRGWRSEINLNPIDVWIHRKVPEEATLKTLLRTREVQMVWSPWRSTEWYTDLANEPFLRVDKMNGAVILNTYQLNCTKPPLDDRHVRRALSYCFDYDTYIKDIRKGLDTRMTSCIGRSYGMFNDQIAPYTLDLNKAEEELSKSKYSKADIGKRSLEFSWTQGMDQTRLAGLLLKTNAEKIGFNISIIGAEYMQYADRVTRPETNPEIATNGASGMYPDPDSILYSQYRTSDYHDATINPMYYSNPEADKLVDEGRASTDPARREVLYKNAQQIIYEDAPCIFVSEVPSLSVMDKRIKGWVYNWEYETYKAYPLRWERS